MENLTGNKIAAAFLITALIFFGLKQLGHVLYTPHKPEKYAYAIDIPQTGAASPVEDGPKGPVDFGLLLASAKAEDGAKVAKKCVSCHTFDKGGHAQTGPNLWGVLGRASASFPGFKYSKAMQGYGKVWDYQNIYDFLANPRKYMKGTAMTYVGLKKEKDRIAMLAYMRQQNDNPPALPEPLKTDPEAGGVPADAGTSGEKVPASPPSGDATQEKVPATPSQDSSEGQKEKTSLKKEKEPSVDNKSSGTDSDENSKPAQE